MYVCNLLSALRHSPNTPRSRHIVVAVKCCVRCGAVAAELPAALWGHAAAADGDDYAARRQPQGVSRLAACVTVFRELGPAAPHAVRAAAHQYVSLAPTVAACS